MPGDVPGGIPGRGPQEGTAAAAALLASLQRTRWTVLGLLAACAAVSLLGGGGGGLPDTLEGLALPLGLGFAFAIFVVRQAAGQTRNARMRVRLLLVTYVLCGLLGVLGAGLTLAGDEGRRGALYALAGGIFALGSTPRLVAPRTGPGAGGA